jgi:cell division protein FtsB
MIVEHQVKTKVAALKQIPWFRVFLLAVTLLLGALYIWQVNVSATRGYVVRDLQDEIEQLRRDDERLKIEVAKLQSVDSVTTRMQMLGLVKIDQIRYLTGDFSVAMR